jgi:hypothetical protein
MTPMKKVVSASSGPVCRLPWLRAQEHGLCAAAGMDLAGVRARPRRAVPQTAHPAEGTPRLGPGAFAAARVSRERACDAGQVRRASERNQGAQMMA